MSDFTAEQKLFLARSAEFQQLIAKDSDLAELDASRIDYDLEGLLLWDVLGGITDICGLKVSPMTPAIWSNLWLLRHPLTTGAVPTFSDVCVAVYMLTHSYVESASDDLKERAAKYAVEKSLTPDVAPGVWNELVEMQKRTEYPLKMLPQSQTTDSENVYDADWLLSICSVVSSEAGISIRDAALNFPLSAAYGLMVIRARKANPTATYRKHTPEWIEKAVMARIHYLSEQFLAEHYPNPSSRVADDNES